MIKKFKEWRRNTSGIRRVNTYTAVIIALLVMFFTAAYFVPVMVDVFIILSCVGAVAFSIWGVVFMSVMM